MLEISWRVEAVWEGGRKYEDGELSCNGMEGEGSWKESDFRVKTDSDTAS